MTFNCKFCNKEFSTISNLNFHQRSAKFCLDIQKNVTLLKESKPDNKVSNNLTEKIYSCEFCDKSFTQKCMLKTHSLNCKVKKEQTLDEMKEQIIKLKENIIELKEQKEQEIRELKEQKEQEIRELKEQKEQEIRELKEQNLIVSIHFEKEKETNKKLEEELEEYKNRLFERDDKITDEIMKRPTAVYNNSQQHINNYNIQYNKMFNDLIPITDDYLKSKIKELITPSSLIYVHNLDNANSNIIDYNFACSLVSILKNNVFFTDIARGKLVYKDENETKMATMAESFILDCISRSKTECLNICKLAIDTVRERENEFTDKDYGQCMMGLGQLSDCIKAGKPHAIITEIANKLGKHSKSIPSVKEFKAKQITTTP
jgi:hypothetical protein